MSDERDLQNLRKAVVTLLRVSREIAVAAKLENDDRKRELEIPQLDTVSGLKLSELGVNVGAGGRGDWRPLSSTKRATPGIGMCIVADLRPMDRSGSGRFDLLSGDLRGFRIGTPRPRFQLARSGSVRLTERRCKQFGRLSECDGRPTSKRGERD